ncbi:MAG: hypothetical protein FWF43_09280 [Propionibacteriaceae bacterium]|nr:hypothetical protein [Propionibacteriaceae bacterium]
MRQPVSLPHTIVDLVAWVARPLGSEWATRVTNQARSARVLDFSPTHIHVESDSTLPVLPIPDGPLPWWASVETDVQVLSEVMVWFHDGRLSQLEQPWYTDEPPSTWPLASQVTVMGPSRRVREDDFPEVVRWFREHPVQGLPFWSDDARAPWGWER